MTIEIIYKKLTQYNNICRSSLRRNTTQSVLKTQSLKVSQVEHWYKHTRRRMKKGDARMFTRAVTGGEWASPWRGWGVGSYNWAWSQRRFPLARGRWWGTGRSQGLIAYPLRHTGYLLPVTQCQHKYRSNSSVKEKKLNVHFYFRIRISLLFIYLFFIYFFFRRTDLFCCFFLEAHTVY